MKVILLKLTKGSPKLGPFDVSDQFGNVIATNVSIYTLIEGINYEVENNVDIVTLTSTGNCTISKSMPITTISTSEFIYTKFEEIKTACLWQHLIFNKFNEYYGIIKPYIIEHPVSTSPNTEILQSVKSYDKVFKYLPAPSGVFSYTDRLQIDNVWFDNVIIYSNQQCTGILELVPKPKNNLQAYNSYPIYKTDSRVILYTKSDDIYIINGFYDIVKDRNVSIAITSCESLSYDGILNQENMQYNNRSFMKSPIRAKDIKCRFTLNSRSDVHVVSQFTIVSTQISYK